jgi:predicted amidophosphoribosyltransferase
VGLLANDIGQFRGPFGPTNYWELPNRGYEWDTGISLGPYRTGPEHKITPIGQLIQNYKYGGLALALRDNLASKITEIALLALWERFESPPFTFLIAVPPNQLGKPALPGALCKNIAAKYPDRFTDVSNAVVRLRSLDSVKGVYKGSRADYLRRAWAIDLELFPPPEKGSGLLIVDDVYDTGATMREMSRTIRAAFSRDVNQFVLTASHVETRDWNQA